jgi:hypothetical protein
MFLVRVTSFIWHLIKTTEINPEWIWAAGIVVMFLLFHLSLKFLNAFISFASTWGLLQSYSCIPVIYDPLVNKSLIIQVIWWQL